MDSPAKTIQNCLFIATQEARCVKVAARTHNVARHTAVRATIPLLPRKLQISAKISELRQNEKQTLKLT